MDCKNEVKGKTKSKGPVAWHNDLLRPGSKVIRRKQMDPCHESSMEVKAQQSWEMDEGQRSPQQPMPRADGTVSGLVTAFPSLSHLCT